MKLIARERARPSRDGDSDPRPDTPYDLRVYMGMGSGERCPDRDVFNRAPGRVRRGRACGYARRGRAHSIEALPTPVRDTMPVWLFMCRDGHDLVGQPISPGRAHPPRYREKNPLPCPYTAYGYIWVWNEEGTERIGGMRGGMGYGYRGAGGYGSAYGYTGANVGIYGCEKWVTDVKSTPII